MNKKTKNPSAPADNHESGTWDQNLNQCQNLSQNQESITTSPESPTHLRLTNHIQIPDAMNNQLQFTCHSTLLQKNNQIKSFKLSELIFINSTQILRQQNLRQTSGKHPIYGRKRSFTHSLESYELYAKKTYIQLMRNFVLTQQFLDYHVIVKFKKQMSIKSFSEKRTKAHGYLAKWKVSGFYVHEPSKSRNSLHVHSITIYKGGHDEIRDCFILAWTQSGLVYKQDFQVVVKPVGATFTDYKRLCAYILKFNGRRRFNLREPRLFIKGLGLRKTGSFGKWFAKDKGEIWREYREECRIRRELTTVSMDEFILYPLKIFIFSNDWNFGFSSFLSFALWILSVFAKHVKMLCLYASKF
jgi:hypothetical protein